MIKKVLLDIIKKEFGTEALKLFKGNDSEDVIKTVLKDIFNNKIKSKHISKRQASVCLRLIKYLEKNGVQDEKTLSMINGIDCEEFADNGGKL